VSVLLFLTYSTEEIEVRIFFGGKLVISSLKNFSIDSGFFNEHIEGIFEFVDERVHFMSDLVFVGNTTQFNINENQNFSVFIFKSVYFNSFGAIYDGLSMIYFVPKMQKSKLTSVNSSISIIGHYESVICINHKAQYVYGHTFIDVMAVLLVFDQSIVDNSHFILLNRPPKHLLEALEIFGIGEGRYHEQTIDQFVYCDHLYVLYPYGFNFYSYKCYKMLQKRLRLYFNLSFESPFRYSLYNRAEKVRKIENFDEIFLKIQGEIPQKHFEKAPFFESLSESSKYFNQVVFFFIGFHGSGMANMFFMQSNTTYVEIHTSFNTMNSIMISRTLSIHHFYLRKPEVSHFQKKSYTLNSTELVHVCKVALGINKP